MGSQPKDHRVRSCLESIAESMSSAPPKPGKDLAPQPALEERGDAAHSLGSLFAAPRLSLLKSPPFSSHWTASDETESAFVKDEKSPSLYSYTPSTPPSANPKRWAHLSALSLGLLWEPLWGAVAPRLLGCHWSWCLSYRDKEPSRPASCLGLPPGKGRVLPLSLKSFLPLGWECEWKSGGTSCRWSPRKGLLVNLQQASAPLSAPMERIRNGVFGIILPEEEMERLGGAYNGERVKRRPKLFQGRQVQMTHLIINDLSLRWQEESDNDQRLSTPWGNSIFLCNSEH